MHSWRGLLFRKDLEHEGALLTAGGQVYPAAGAPDATRALTLRRLVPSASAETAANDDQDPQAQVELFRSSLAGWLAESHAQKCAELAEVACALEAGVAKAQPGKKAKQVAEHREQRVLELGRDVARHRDAKVLRSERAQPLLGGALPAAVLGGPHPLGGNDLVGFGLAL